MKLKTIFLSVLIATFFSCSKKPLQEDNYVTLSYRQTICADPWTNLSSDSLTVVNIRNFITSNNLYIAGISIKQETQADPCNACACKTGKTVYVTTFDDESIKAKYASLGFK